MSSHFFPRALTAAAALALILTGGILPAQASTPHWVISTAIGSQGGDAALTSVASTSASNAWSAGDTCGSPCSAHALAVERWNGAKWHPVAVPSSLANVNVINTVVATSSAKNTWVFADVNQPSQRAYALRWTGKHWSLAKFPALSDITSAAAFRPGNAWAFGKSGSSGKPYDIHWNGSKWRAVSMPGTPQAISQALSAVSATDMWAIGPTIKTATKPYGHQTYIVMHWNGRTWHKLALPKVSIPAGDFVIPAAITALGPKNVWEAYDLGNAGTCCFYGGLEHWNGSKWKTASISLPPPTGVYGMAQDGHGGLWLSVSASTRTFYHRSKAGAWTQHDPPTFVNATVIAGPLSWIPGTTSMWSAGYVNVGQPDPGNAGVVLKYGP